MFQKSLKTRKLTKKEKILLSVLAGVILIWASFKFIITPQREKVASLKSQKIEYENQIAENNMMLKKEGEINDEWIELNIEKEQIVSKYFPTIDQSQIIYLLNSLMENAEFSAVDLNFSRPTYEEIGEFEVQSMDVSIPYNGNYDGIMDTINSLDKSPRKIFIDSLVVDKDSELGLNGSIDLKVYSLEGIAESDSNVIPIDITSSRQNKAPFSEYDYYIVENEVQENLDEISEDTFDENQTSGSYSSEDSYEGVQKKEISPYRKDLLLDFEDENSYFMPSQALVKGRVSKSNNAKKSNYSLRFEYDILAVEEENVAYVDISKNNITLKYPPESIGMWIYSYDYSPITVGIGFKGQMGEEEFLPLTEGIGWIGWKYLEVTPPNDLSIYPLKVDKLYVEMPKNREDFGIILMDGLEATYTRNLTEDGFVENEEEFIFHIVKPGENIDDISKSYYGTRAYGKEILRINDMKNGDKIPAGKVLVLKKR